MTLRLTALAALLAAGPAVSAHAQVIPEPDATEVAKTPLRDFNVDARDIPDVLLLAVRDPYAAAGTATCDAIVTEVAALDDVLGADYDIAQHDGSDRFSEGRIAQGMVGSVIPFRGILREVTGAADNDRALRAAYTAGMVRRSFLKGLGMGRSCAYPARPKPVVAGD